MTACPARASQAPLVRCLAQHDALVAAEAIRAGESCAYEDVGIIDSERRKLHDFKLTLVARIGQLARRQTTRSGEGACDRGGCAGRRVDAPRKDRVLSAERSPSPIAPVGLKPGGSTRSGPDPDALPARLSPHPRCRKGRGCQTPRTGGQPGTDAVTVQVEAGRRSSRPSERTPTARPPAPQRFADARARRAPR